MNSDFRITPIAAKGLPADVPASLVPKRLGARAAFETTAPSWFIASMRNVLLDYVAVRHLRLAANDGAFATTDRTIQQPDVMQQLLNVVCGVDAPLGAQYTLDYTNASQALVCVQLRAFRGTAHSGAIAADVFEPSIYFHYLNVGKRLHVEAEVVEEMAYLSGVRPMIHFVYTTAKIRELSLSRTGVDDVWCGRDELDVGPFTVTLQLHGDRTLGRLLADGRKAVLERLDALVASWGEDGAGIIQAEVNVAGRGFGGYLIEAVEPRSHVVSMLCGYVSCVSDVKGEKYPQFKVVDDAVTNKASLRVVWGGTRAELAADLREQVAGLKKIVESWNGPA